MRRTTALAIAGLILSVASADAQAPRTPRAPRAPRTPAPPARVEQPVSGCGFLGIYPNDIGRKTHEKLGLGERTGAIVAGVVENTGAARAGVLEKDVVTALNGELITSEAQLRRLIISQRPGAYVRLDLFRDGRTITVNAEITARSKYYRGAADCPNDQIERPQQQQIEQRMRDAVKDMDLGSLEIRQFDNEMRTAERALAEAQKELRVSVLDFREHRDMVTGYEGNTGLGLQKLTQQLAEYFRTGSTSGALVNEVAESSPASRSGIQAGDVIVGVNGIAVAGPMDAVKGIVDDNDGSVDVRVIRDGRERTLEIKTNRGTNTGTPNVLPNIGAHTAPQRGPGQTDLQ